MPSTIGGYNRGIAKFIYNEATKLYKYGSPKWAAEVAKGLKAVGAEVPKWIKAILKII